MAGFVDGEGCDGVPSKVVLFPSAGSSRADLDRWVVLLLLGSSAPYRRRSRVASRLVVACSALAVAVAVPAQVAQAAPAAPGTRVAPVAATAARSAAVVHPLTAYLSKPAAKVGSKVRVRGAVAPARRDVTVRVERRTSGHWHLVKATTTTATGAYSTVIRTRSTRGFSAYRVVVPAATGVSRAVVTLPRFDSYSLHTYVVRKRGNVTVSMKDFARRSAATYADPRGWKAAHHRFARVSKGGSFTLVLAEARYLPSYSSVCSVRYSCRAGRYVVINQSRWRSGSKPFTGSLLAYRRMVVNHETGHWLGRGHDHCGGKGKLAPVMQQQSKFMQGCKPNAWPLPAELRAVS